MAFENKTRAFTSSSVSHKLVLLVLKTSITQSKPEKPPTSRDCKHFYSVKFNE